MSRFVLPDQPDVSQHQFRFAGEAGPVVTEAVTSRPPRKYRVTEIHVTVRCGGAVDVTAYGRRLTKTGLVDRRQSVAWIANPQFDHEVAAMFRAARGMPEVEAVGAGRHVVRPINEVRRCSLGSDSVPSGGPVTLGRWSERRAPSLVATPGPERSRRSGS
jgi:hypothetical protein